MFARHLLVAALAALCCPGALLADGAPRPDGHAPIGVMGDHLHARGETMLSYRYMRMSMDGNCDGTCRRSTTDVLLDPRFLVTPTTMDMEMHMFGAMWAPDDAVTLMAMVPFVRKDMRHVELGEGSRGAGRC